ncbi:hypothetical protein F7644_12335 [Tenacibaculum finnmarkense genomovar ulcerans]|uniref:toxin-antitoxin system YwqK family antitoxin n=1 Tax=Tenacibaculum finnmarkense TaxID=2781243 RepID=UPI00187BB898|nr:hypothetical protein [Tenacibaculum finnmarkense]MBE7646768.1 hypothetical protein [Tenacibaculum finnmarkense genomovar ulcerans]
MANIKKMKHLIIFLISILVSCAQTQESSNENTEKVYFNTGELKEEGVLMNDKKEGLWITYNEDSIIQTKINYKNNLMDGLAIRYNKLGETSKKITYKNGLREGYYETNKILFDENYKPMSKFPKTIGTYKNDTIKIGKWTSYYEYEEKLLHSTENYNNDGVKIGKWNEYFKNGRLKHIKHFNKLGDRVKSWKYYFNDNTIEKEMYYDEKGNKIGVWKEYYENGELYYKADYPDGELNGFYKTGEQKFKGQLMKEELQGKFTEFYKNGSIRTIKNFENGIKKSIGISYYKNKQIEKKCTYINDTLYSGNYVEYYEKGQLKSSRNFNKEGIPIGKWEEYYENGNLSILSKLPDGTHKVFYKNGNIKIKGQFKNSLEDGLFKEFYENGKLKGITEYPNGEAIEYYPDGTTIKLKIEFNNHRKENGNYISYYETGNLESTGNFKNGLKEGIWQYFDYYSSEEKLVRITEYNNGLEVTEKSFFKNGDYYIITLNKEPLSIEPLSEALLYNEEKFNASLYNKDNQTIGEGKMSSVKYKSGRWKFYYITGELKKVVYYDSNVEVGNEKEYYKSGQLKSIRLGSEKYSEYHPNGNLKMTGKMWGDKLDGVCVFYDINGKLKKKVIYQLGDIKE